MSTLTTGSRRIFLGSAAAMTAASYGRILGANDRIRLGGIGVGPRGQYLMKELIATGLTEWVAVCDVYDVRRDEAATLAGGNVKTYGDHRHVLEHKDIDAVIVATPDHWHGPIAVDACQAGKDVYVEKPMVHTPADGQAIVRAVRENRRILQVGVQSRGVPHCQEARQKFVNGGILGPIGFVRTWYDGNAGYLQKPPQNVDKKPEGLDWERWLGPAPHVAWNPGIYFSPYKWLHYDGGMMMGIGIHVIDLAHHYLKLTKPASAIASGGIYRFADRDTPDVVNVILEYPDKLNLTFGAEIFSTTTRRLAAGIALHGIGGVLTVARENWDWGYEFVPSRANGKAPAQTGPSGVATPTYILRNWLDCIRSREKPIADEVSSYYSSVACFMGLEATRTRSRVTWQSGWDL